MIIMPSQCILPVRKSGCPFDLLLFSAILKIKKKSQNFIIINFLSECHKTNESYQKWKVLIFKKLYDYAY